MAISEANNARYPRRDFIAWILIFACATLAYFPAFNGGFVWDDDGHVCPQTLRSLHGLLRIWTDLGATQQYYPILHSAFWLEYRLWGEAVLGYHLTNLVLHVTAACLVIAIMRRLTLPGAWLAGFIFALHPVCVESVAWISEQKNTLSTVLCLSAALVYLRFDQSRQAKHYALALLLFLLALLTKTVTATLPVVLLIVFWWQRGRLRWREDIMPLIPWLAIGAASGLFTAWVERTYIGAQGADFTLSFGQRGLLAGRVVWFYLWKLVWPTNLIFIYPRWTPDTSVIWQYFFPIALVALAAGLLWFARKKSRGPFAALLAYGAMLFPALGFVNVYPFIFSFVADHFQYLASIAIIVPASGGLALATQQLTKNRPRWSGTLAAVPVVAILGILTFRQTQLYGDNEILYRGTLARNPDCWLALNNLGNILAATPEHKTEAIELYEKALKIKPDYPEAHFNLANLLAKNPATRFSAITHFEAALISRPDYAEAHNNLGSLLARDQNQLSEAIAHFREAIRLKPNFVAAHSNLGTALARIPGCLPDAISHYQIALKIDPSSAETHFDLANALAKSTNTQTEVIAQYEAALHLNPNYAEAHCNLAVLLSKIPDRRSEAIVHYETVLRLHPEWDFAQRALERLQQIQPKIP